MSEFLDICNEKGEPVGQTVPREIAHRDGIRHRTAHVWIARERDGVYEILLQKRSMHKDSFPGFYDTSSAGHIPAGDEPRESALRELKEELGIEAAPEDLAYVGTFRSQYETEFYGKPFRDNEVTQMFVYQKPVRIEDLVLQESEVEEVRWFLLKEVWNEIQTNRARFCMPWDSLYLLRNYFGISSD